LEVGKWETDPINRRVSPTGTFSNRYDLHHCCEFSGFCA
jgi:hypothetical protein